MLTSYVRLFIELYGYTLRNSDRDIQSIVDSILNKQGFHTHLVCAGAFNDSFVKKYGIDSPALSLGITFTLPIGVVLLHRSFLKGVPRDWIEFAIAHELGHICLNHFPIDVLISETWNAIPQNLRELWIRFKSIAYAISSLLSAEKSYRFPVEEITAQKELAADQWAVRALGRKEPALEFLNWIKEQGITVSHISPVGGFPALTIDERIRHLENLVI